MSHPLGFNRRQEPFGEIPQTPSAESGNATGEEVTQGAGSQAAGATEHAGYKRTEAGVVPEDWETTPLRRICSMKSGESITSADIDDTSRFPCHGGNGLRGFTDRFTHSGRFALIGRQGALCGNVVGVSGRFFASEHAVVVTALQQTDIGWLTYVLRGMCLNQYSESSAQPGLSVAKLLLLDVARPPTRAEQRAIAAVLTDADALIGSLEALIAKKRAIKRAAMQQLLTGRTRLPGYEGQWGTGRLRDVAQLHRDHVMPSDEDDVGYEVFSLPAYDAGRSPSTELGAAIQSGKFRVPHNSVLLSRLNPRIPRVWAPPSVGPNAIASTEFLVLTPRESTVRGFLFWLCSSPRFCDRMVTAVTGTTGSHQRVNRVDAMNLRIRFPPPAEQKAIAAVLTDIDDEVAALECRLDKTRAVKQGMMQQLLTGAVRLPIPDDELEGESHDA